MENGGGKNVLGAEDVDGKRRRIARALPGLAVQGGDVQNRFRSRARGLDSGRIAQIGMYPRQPVPGGRAIEVRHRIPVAEQGDHGSSHQPGPTGDQDA